MCLQEISPTHISFIHAFFNSNTQAKSKWEESSFFIAKADIEDYLGMTIKLSTPDDVGFFGCSLSPVI